MYLYPHLFMTYSTSVMFRLDSCSISRSQAMALVQMVEEALMGRWKDIPNW